MDTTKLTFTNRQAANVAGVMPHTLDNHRKRTGTFRGVSPIKLDNRRVVWPRREFVAATCPGLHRPQKTLPGNAAESYLSIRGVPFDDPLVIRVLILFLSLQNDPDMPPDDMADQVYLSTQFLIACVSRLEHDKDRMDGRQYSAAEHVIEYELAKLGFVRSRGAKDGVS